MAQYPVASSSGTFRVVTKADTASTTSLGSNTSVGSDGGADTYGSWGQIIASTAAESYITEVAIQIGASTLAAGDMPIFLELGTGGAGSESVKWEGFAAYTNSGTGANGLVLPLVVPLRVTSGKRIATRIKLHSATNTNFKVYVFGLPITQTEGN